MTRKEAIRKLKQYYMRSVADMTEALEMAISSLEADEKYQLEYERAKEKVIDDNKPPTNDWEAYADRLHDIAYENGYEQAKKDMEPCEDAISRNDLLDTLNNKFASIAEINDVIIGMPSVQPILPKCEDSISRQAAIDCCRNEWEEEVEERLKKLPSVRPARNKGEWIRGQYTDDDIRYNDTRYKCSKCGKISAFEENFCSRCGCEMEDDNADSD